MSRFGGVLTQYLAILLKFSLKIGVSSVVESSIFNEIQQFVVEY